jgi:fermentation-respiration switch protein FrsA (DUF1100 family)
MVTYSALNYQDQVKGLILQNTIASIKSLVHEKAAVLEPALPLIQRLYLPSEDRIKNIHLKMLFIVGLADEQTGPEQMKILYDNSEQSATSRDYYEIERCDHYLTLYYGGAEFDERLIKFVNNALQKSDSKVVMKEYLKQNVAYQFVGLLKTIVTSVAS